MNKRIFASIITMLLLSQPGRAVAQYLFASGGSSGDIYRYTMDGTRTTVTSGLAYRGLAVDDAGNLFAASPAPAGNAIFKFTPDGTRTTFASGLNMPWGLAFDSYGNLFEADFLSGSIYEFTPSGARSTFASGLVAPYGVAFDNNGNLFVTAYQNSSLYKITPNGVVSSFGSGLENPIGIACDAIGNVFVADLGGGNGDGSIYRFTSAGTRTTFASGLEVMGLAVDSARNVYAAEYGGYNIYKFNPLGTRSIFASDINGPFFLAYEVPEPSVQAMLGMASLLLVGLPRILRGAICPTPFAHAPIASRGASSQSSS
jgi:streptogramin lyase